MKLCYEKYKKEQDEIKAANKEPKRNSREILCHKKTENYRNNQKLFDNKLKQLRNEKIELVKYKR